jgi:hypothetical protein
MPEVFFYVLEIPPPLHTLNNPLPTLKRGEEMSGTQKLWKKSVVFDSMLCVNVFENGGNATQQTNEYHKAK